MLDDYLLTLTTLQYSVVFFLDANENEKERNAERFSSSIVKTTAFFFSFWVCYFSEFKLPLVVLFLFFFSLLTCGFFSTVPCFMDRTSSKLAFVLKTPFFFFLFLLSDSFIVFFFRLRKSFKNALNVSCPVSWHLPYCSSPFVRVLSLFFPVVSRDCCSLSFFSFLSVCIYSEKGIRA